MSESTYLQPFPCQMSENSLFLCNDWCFYIKHRPFHVRKYIFAAFPMHAKWVRTVCFCGMIDVSTLTHLAWESRKYVLSDMKRRMIYEETSIIRQKQTLFTHLAWERLQICTFWILVLFSNRSGLAPNHYIWRPPKNVHQIKWQTKGRLNNVHQIKYQTEGRQKNKITTNFVWSSKKRPPKCKLPKIWIKEWVLCCSFSLSNWNHGGWPFVHLTLSVDSINSWEHNLNKSKLSMKWLLKVSPSIEGYNYHIFIINDEMVW